MSELTISEFASDSGIPYHVAREMLEKKLAAAGPCRLRDSAWKARDGWPATNAKAPPELDIARGGASVR